MRRGSDDVARVGRHVPRTRDRETELEHHLENVTSLLMFSPVFVSMSLSFHRGNAFYWKNIVVAYGYNLSRYPIASYIGKHASLLKKHSSFVQDIEKDFIFTVQ